MSDTLLKLKILFDDLILFLSHWKENIWDQDLDSFHCCNGHECGCLAVTKREVLSHHYRYKIPWSDL